MWIETIRNYAPITAHSNRVKQCSTYWANNKHVDTLVDSSQDWYRKKTSDRDRERMRTILWQSRTVWTRHAALSQRRICNLEINKNENEWYLECVYVMRLCCMVDDAMCWARYICFECVFTFTQKVCVRVIHTSSDETTIDIVTHQQDQFHWQIKRRIA